MCKACSTPRQALGAKRIETFGPATARQQPTPADAVKSVMAKNGMSAEPDPSVTTLEARYGPDLMEMATIYKPAAAKARDRFRSSSTFMGAAG